LLVLGDVNDDGKLDIITASAYATGVSVLLGTGGGHFALHADYATGSYPISLALADVNSDQHLDIVAADTLGTAVSVLLGTGDGTFAGKVDYETGTYPNSVALGDLNGDDTLDLAVANFGSASVSVLLGTGTRTQLRRDTTVRSYFVKRDGGGLSTGVGSSVGSGSARRWRPPSTGVEDHGGHVR